MSRPAWSISKLNSSPGDEGYPAFSPDGTQVAFASNGERRDNADIYIKRIDADTPQRLTTDPAHDSGALASHLHGRHTRGGPAWRAQKRSVARIMICRGL